MSRSSDDHDFSDRGLDIRPPRPEETEYVRERWPAPGEVVEMYELRREMVADSAHPGWGEPADPEDGDERISTFCQRCRVWTLPGRPCPHEDGEA